MPLKMKRRHGPKLALNDKAFRRNAQPLEASNVPGGLGEHHQQANATGQKNRPVAFLQSVATPALLADVIPKQASIVDMLINYHQEYEFFSI